MEQGTLQIEIYPHLEHPSHSTIPKINETSKTEGVSTNLASDIGTNDYFNGSNRNECDRAH
ncbi:MAG: hypothetical protein F6J92_02325 [Symploca sp. SIO1A3]|nr:hypothetical protein [Symploca sp. SIO1A3]